MSAAAGRILLIDDEEVVLDSCRAILEGSDHQVAAATGGAEGLDTGPQLSSRTWSSSI